MDKKPLHYTFGNHMHWVDLQWSRGGLVLPQSTRDMLALCASTGAKGNVDFDGLGYERLAAEAPEVFEALRAAIRAGTIEVVGASFGQPCGLFHGGESNVRQLIHGTRVVRRLFGVWPTAFGSEAFAFFPQLPQLLAGAGVECATLFFPWTRQTPHMPDENTDLILWEGLDGTRLPALPNHAMCVAPWAGDLARALDSSMARDGDALSIVHWLELTPFPDGLCRSELVLPELAKMFADPRFELNPCTMTELVRKLVALRADPPVRRYALDETWHGMTLGKNGDYMPRYSRSAEEQLLAAESVSALAGLFGRPYPTSGVYPTWELEEAWRELLTAQHHAVHESEGQCGAVGERLFERSVALASEVFARTLEHLGRRVDALEGSTLVYNALGWTRDVAHDHGVVRSIPAFGYKVVDPYDEIEEPRLGRIRMEAGDRELVLVRGDFEVHIERARGLITQICSKAYPEGCLPAKSKLGALEMRREGTRERFETVNFSSESGEHGEFAEFTFLREGRGGSRVRVVYSMSMLHDALWIRLQGENVARPDGGLHAGLQMPIHPRFKPSHWLHDHPYGISSASPTRNFTRRYPTGDWATSPRTHENVLQPLTGSSFVDLLEDAESGRGLLVVHDGGQQFLRDEAGVRALLHAYDPWDEDHYDNVFEAEMWIVPHGAMSSTDRARLSMELNLGSPRFEDSASVHGGGDLPPQFGSVDVDASNVLVTALYREHRRAGEHVPGYFGVDVRDPFVIRLVEYDGRAADVTLRLPGPIARAAKTNLQGSVLTPLSPRVATPPFGPAQLPWSALCFRMRPHEVATIMVDLEFGREVPVPLDAHRHLWVGERQPR